MSFTTVVKTEISSIKTTNTECLAELSGFLRSNFKKINDEKDIYTENINAAKRIYSFLKELYGIKCDIVVRINPMFKSRKTYHLLLKEKRDFILQDLSVYDSDGSFIKSTMEYIVGSEDEIKSYIRGSFLACGSINDPKTSQYHLEFLFDYKEESVFVQRLLNGFDLNAKILIREKKYMVYLKDSDDISDFLKIIGAYNAVMYYENIRAIKEKKNITNRLNNCEQANTDKVIVSSNEQLKDIQLIKEKIGIDFLDDRLREVIQYRIKYPESSLNELSEIISLETNKKITKSGLNHRFRKIKELANKIREKDKKNNYYN